MAVDIFLKVDGAPGEAMDDKHKNEIDVLSFSFGASQTGAFHSTGAGGGAGRAEIQDLTITKYVDKSSSKLFGFCAQGKHIENVVLTSQKAGGNKLEYYKITLQKAIVSSVMNSGSADGDKLMETVSFNTAIMQFDYAEQTEQGGLGGKTFAKIDIAQNKISY